MQQNTAWVPEGCERRVLLHKQARRAKRVAEGHQLEIGAQQAPRFLVYLYIAFLAIFSTRKSFLEGFPKNVQARKGLFSEVQ